MKKILLILTLLALPLTAQAAGYKRPAQLFNNISTTGYTSSTMDTRLFPDQSTWELVVATGSPSAYSVSIQGSIRCVNGIADADSWHDISEFTEASTPPVGLRHVALKPVRCIRAKLNSISGGGSFDVYLLPRY